MSVLVSAEQPLQYIFICPRSMSDGKIVLPAIVLRTQFNLPTMPCVTQLLNCGARVQLSVHAALHKSAFFKQTQVRWKKTVMKVLLDKLIHESPNY